MSRVVNVHFITDTEGHLPSLLNSVNKSKVVEINDTYQLNFKKSIANPYFIFGGDLTDRGVGDTKLMEILLDFKRRHPEQVFLLVGNREASKNRFFIELNPKYIRQRLLEGSAPFWLLSAPHQLPIDYVKKHMQDNQVASDDLINIKAYIDSLDISTCQLIYLKWMLEQNLGCPHTFEYHAQELAQKNGCQRKSLSDNDILQSMIMLNSPQGLMGEYLSQTQMVAMVPDSGIIAVHGGFTPENIGRLPYRAIDAPIIANARTWLEQINNWYFDAVGEWMRIDQSSLPLALNPARSKLDTFSERVPSEYRSIVTASMLSPTREFQAVSKTVSDYLNRAGISIVLSGHQPSGDHPAIVRSSDDSVLFINGDVSYANASEKNTHDTRGHAWHSINLEASGDETTCCITASLANGVENYTEIRHKDGLVVDDSLVGKVLPGGELVQCRLSCGNYYRTVSQKGFEVNYRFRHVEKIMQLLENAQSAEQNLSMKN